MSRKLILAAFAAIALFAISACGTTTVNTSPTAPAAAASAAGGSGSSKATVGDTLALAGNEGTKLEVTLKQTKRLPALKAWGSQMHPAVYGVLLTVKNTGSQVYDDTIGNCVSVIDTKDQQVDCELPINGKNGELPGQLWTVKIAPGDKRSGWVFFSMGKKQDPRTLQFTPDSGFGPQVGEWTLN